VCGAPGADTQDQPNFQLLIHAYDFGYTSRECVEAPRWTQLQNPMNSTFPHTTHEALQIERRAGFRVLAGAPSLTARG
ncbi:MAG: gamma-glutamyltransferase, partial [Acidobacteria bacterium]|nr:gamma-glutamyltransferase [Acidobacteriota bacterium]